jgi:ribonuclease HI
MELEAPSEALRLVLRGKLPISMTAVDRIAIRSDSRYVCEHIGSATYRWPKTKWRTSDGKAVQNEEDWRTLVSLIQKVYRELHLRVTFEWQPGKIGAHATAVDKLAKKSAASASFGRARPAIVRRKISKAQVDPGSVRVTGQQLRIHVLDPRRISRDETRYRYEVVDPSSPDNGKVDFAETSHHLAPGHTYDVTMNADQKNPRIDGVISEVEEDLTPYVDALRAIGHAASATDVAAAIAQTGRQVTPPRAKRALEKLVQRGEANKERAPFRGRPFLYSVVSV